MIKVFLVEDEPPALRKLERMVAGTEYLSVCGTAATCAEAIAGALRTKPQLLIVDVRLPDGTGFEVLQALEELADLHAIFLTAYDQYAVQAFDVAALDYLLKPVTQDRFLQAIERVRNRLAAPVTAAKKRYTRRFLVERLRAAYLLPVESIYRIEADRNYALLYSDMGEFAVRATMDSLEQRLDPAEFARVSRSAIVRVGAIREVRKREEPNHVIVLTSGDEVVCSRRYWTSALEQLL
jgi:two-component system, LytTR family, response regulator